MSTKKYPPLRNDELVNYLFRPAKNIERKMLCEAFSRLSTISDIRTYQYVGFGSVYFADFTLFHKHLGIQKLISIESDEDMEPRIKFNQPYSCIEIMSGWSYEMLPEIDWNENRTILWLDYTESLKGYMLKDIATFFFRATSGSVFVISINVDIRDDLNENSNTHTKIINKINKDNDVRKRIPSRDINENMSRNDYYYLIRMVIDSEIKQIISDRNRLENSTKYEYKQLFNFLYHDGQAMLTIGGVFYSEDEKDKIDLLNFSDLDFIVTDENYFHIKVPNLTYREINAIDKHLPKFSSDTDAKIKAINELKGIVSEDSIHKYAKIYRYFPKYNESNF